MESEKMATTRPEIEKLLKKLRDKVTKADLEWLKKEYSAGYKRYEELIETKDDLGEVSNTQALIYGIQYLIDAIKREIGNSYQYADIPKAYVKKLAEIMGIPIKGKFNKRDVINQILNDKKTTV